MIFRIGAVMGLFAAGVLIAAVGHIGVFLFTATACCTRGLVTGARILFDAPTSPAGEERFVGAPRTATSAAAPLAPARPLRPARCDLARTALTASGVNPLAP